MIHFTNDIAEFLVNQSWQILVVFIVIAAGSLALHKASAHWRYLLWLLVLIKCVTPPVFSIPLAVLPENEAQVSVAPNIATADNPVGIQMQTKPSDIHYAPVSMDILVSKQAGEEPTNFELSSDASTGGGTGLTEAEPAATTAVVVSTPTAKTPTDFWKTATYWSAICWLVGSSLFAVIALIKAVLLQRRLHRLRRPVGLDLQAEVATLAGVLGMKSPPEVWLVDDYSQPFVCGLVRGSVYFRRTYPFTDLRG